MGTRAYAESVAQLIDPDGHFFKERILSRDESGSKVCHDWIIFFYYCFNDVGFVFFSLISLFL
jgi:hypothetical protein